MAPAGGHSQRAQPHRHCLYCSSGVRFYGQLLGQVRPSACGSLGYAFADAMKAKKVVVITDHLMDYPLTDASITEDYVDYVVNVPAIGDPLGIVSGTTRMPKDPIALKIADLAAQAIDASGLLKDGFSFQTGAGGASLAVAEYLKQIMLRKNIKGSFALGGITGLYRRNAGSRMLCCDSGRAVL